jgi:hypothetical protein
VAVTIRGGLDSRTGPRPPESLALISCSRDCSYADPAYPGCSSIRASGRPTPRRRRARDDRATRTAVVAQRGVRDDDAAGLSPGADPVLAGLTGASGQRRRAYWLPRASHAEDVAVRSAGPGAHIVFEIVLRSYPPLGENSSAAQQTTDSPVSPLVKFPNEVQGGVDR